MGAPGLHRVCDGGRISPFLLFFFLRRLVLLLSAAVSCLALLYSVVVQCSLGCGMATALLHINHVSHSPGSDTLRTKLL